MRVDYYANKKNKADDFRNAVNALVEKYNPRPKIIEERVEGGVVVKVYEAR